MLTERYYTMHICIAIIYYAQIHIPTIKSLSNHLVFLLESRQEPYKYDKFNVWFKGRLDLT